ncbi:hypothetical protein D3C86_1672810 [compost metagenome]
MAERGGEHLFLGEFVVDEIAAQLAFADHQDAVGDAEHFGQLRGHHDDRHAVGRQRPHQLVDFVLGADIHASGGLIENQYPGFGQKHFRQHGFLLIAAREAGDWQERARGFEMHARDFPVDAAQFGFGVDAGHFRVIVQHGQGDVLADAQIRNDALALAVLGHHAQAGAD